MVWEGAEDSSGKLGADACEGSEEGVVDVVEEGWEETAEDGEEVEEEVSVSEEVMSLSVAEVTSDVDVSASVGTHTIPAAKRTAHNTHASTLQNLFAFTIATPFFRRYNFSISNF